MGDVLMMPVRWTDDRLDDLAKRVDEGFEKADKAFERLELAVGGIRDNEVKGLKRKLDEAHRLAGEREEQAQERAREERDRTTGLRYVLIGVAGTVVAGIMSSGVYILVVH